jgi:hypothetical protein
VSHAPFETEAPDLLSTSIEGEDVVYCFDEEIQQVFGAGNFFLHTYDSAVQTSGTDVDLDQDEACVRAAFAGSDLDLVDYTIAGVLDSAVQDQDTDGNYEATAALEGIELDDPDGDTQAPELIDFEENEPDDQITYEFDENVEDNCPTDASSFGYYLDDGENGGRNIGTSISGCDEREVTVNFTVVDDLARVFVDTDGDDGGSGGDEPCNADPAGGACTQYAGAGSNTDDPDLTGARRSDDDEWTFEFDEELSGVDPSRFRVRAEDGTSYTPTGCSVDAHEVVCTFPALELALETEIVSAVADDGATGADDTGDDNTVGDADLSDTGLESGASDGPDLESCDIDEANDVATFFFDEHIDESSASLAGIDLFESDGTEDDATGIDDSEEEEGSITFEFSPDAIEDAVGCHVEGGSIEDPLNNASPRASVGFAELGSENPSTTSSSSGSTTDSPTPTTRRVRTSLSIRYDRDAGAFEGSVGSANRRCRRGRMVELTRRGRGVQGEDRSNRRGNWSIRKRARRGRFFAVAARKVFTAANGDTVICRTDESPTIRLGRRRR